ncbi:MAG: DUF523 domain-containing protein [Pseudomonadota bacterium]
MQKILISSCLLGEKVRYDGLRRGIDNDILRRWEQEGRLVPVCPEVAGGLPVPRPPSEITGKDKVTGKDGRDVSAAFVAGAGYALSLVKKHSIKAALLKEGSPSCGTHEIHDGSFTGKKTSGSGVTVSLLREAGVAVFSEHEIGQADAFIRQLETPPAPSN